VLMDRANQVQVPKVVWWRRYLPDVLVMLLLLIVMRPHIDAATLFVIGLLMLFWSVLAGGMVVLGGCALLLTFWFWVGGDVHRRTACGVIYSLIRPWLPEHGE